jgi:glycosyltransferase involved in cell wall biosynthesis
MTEWPSVDVVVPTRERPEQLRAAIASALAQDYPGRIRIIVVYDQSKPDERLADDDRVRVMSNSRTPGLAGGRNTGISASEAEMVAFCDDDDVWLPGKLRAQVEAMRAAPGSEFSSCGIVVDYDGRSNDRLVGRDQVTYEDLLVSRMVMVHSSTFLADRSVLLNGIGLLDEQIPGSQNEDWDLALRASRRRPIVHVDEPLVRVAWGTASYFSRQWESKADSLVWMLERHPDISGSRGAARVYGQLAFAYACLGRRRDAGVWATRALRKNWREPRTPFALAVAAGIVSGDTVLRLLHNRGHGI